MGFTFETTTKPEEAASFLANCILNQLKQDKHVLLFLSGGSAILVAEKVASILREHRHDNLTVMLTDERYGPVGHKDSNFLQLIEKGFNLPEAKIFPVLAGADIGETTAKWNELLMRELARAEYRIGLFGIGSDGHTAGILPDSRAVESEALACFYDTPQFSRITITYKAIEKLDEAVVWARGQEKWEALKNLKQNIDIAQHPAQILKKVPLLTIFTDLSS